MDRVRCRWPMVVAFQLDRPHDRHHPAAIAPGLLDNATIGGPAPDQFQIVAGPALATALTLRDDEALLGTFSVGTLTIGQNRVGAADVLASATLAATGGATDAGNVEVNGAGAAWTAAGTLIQADALAAGGDVLAVNGAAIQAGTWAVAGTVYVDPTAFATVAQRRATAGTRLRPKAKRATSGPRAPRHSRPRRA